ncbi:MAG: molybdopterin-dependent oxidoreductase [Caldilineaceae bacterium]|nr:molybdopterin-dependent oxidoreductase [Caldilineaceae bacterium]
MAEQLHEEYIYNEKGLLVNGSLLDYRMPTALDLPMIETILVSPDRVLEAVAEKK